MVNAQHCKLKSSFSFLYPSTNKKEFLETLSISLREKNQRESKNSFLLVEDIE